MSIEKSLPNGDRDDWEDRYHIEMEETAAKEWNKLFEKTPIISQKAIWQNAENHGWHNPPCDLATDLLLVHSEMSEACEALRKRNLRVVRETTYEDDTTGKKVVFDGSVEEELADAVIRIFHIAEKNGFDICKTVAAKHGLNVDRPYRHGNKAF